MRISTSLLFLALVVPSVSQAFCGLYVSEPGKQIHNQGSSVILAQTGGQTTLTVESDFSGDVSTFGLLIPMPASITEDDVQVVDVAMFDFLDGYTTPRLVQYNCADMATARHSNRDVYLGCGADYALMADAGAFDTADVEVESRFTVGEYEIAVLTAEDGDSLTAWLNNNGFAAPADRDGILQGYIDNGTHFLAARVVLDAVPEGQAWLHPLRFTYNADRLHLPIRIGTISAEGVQDLTVYAITDADAGQVRITNYPEVAVEDECLWMPEGDETLDGFYQGRIAAGMGDQAGWWTEYSIDVIGQASCDPCTGPAPLFIQDLQQYGWNGELADTGPGGISGGARLTRMHVRYTPEQAVDDLDFDTMGADLPLSQVRYVQYAEGLEAWFPVCGEGWMEDPPSCPEAEPQGSSVPIGSALGFLAMVTGFGIALRRNA